MQKINLKQNNERLINERGSTASTQIMWMIFIKISKSAIQIGNKKY